MGSFICAIDGFRYSNRASYRWHMEQKHPEVGMEPEPPLEELPTGAVIGGLAGLKGEDDTRDTQTLDAEEIEAPDGTE